MGGGPSRVKAGALEVVPPSCRFIPASDARLQFQGRIARQKEGWSFNQRELILFPTEGNRFCWKENLRCRLVPEFTKSQEVQFF